MSKEVLAFFGGLLLLDGLLNKLLLLVYVDGQDDRSRRDLRRPEIEELWLCHCKFTDLVAHVVNDFLMIVLQDPQEPLHALHGAWHVKIKVKLINDVELKIYKWIFAHMLFLGVGQEVDHSVETWLYWLLQLGCHQKTYHCKGTDLLPGEVFRSDFVQISVHDRASCEKRFNFIIFPGVKIKNLLNSIRSVILRDVSLFWFWSLLTLFSLFLIRVQIIGDGKSFLVRSDSEVHALGEFWLLLPFVCFRNTITLYIVLRYNIDLVWRRQIFYHTFPPDAHHLGEVRLWPEPRSLLVLDCLVSVLTWGFKTEWLQGHIV